MFVKSSRRSREVWWRAEGRGDAGAPECVRVGEVGGWFARAGPRECRGVRVWCARIAWRCAQSETSG